MTKPVEIFVLNKAIRLKQPENGFRTCLDSVLLAASCLIKPREHVLDLGCGVGGAGLCVLYRVPDTHMTGLEIQEDHIHIARDNAALNKVAGRADFLHKDIRAYKTAIGFDHVICNPPYMEDGSHLPSPHERKARAHGADTSLQDWIDCAYRSLKPGGSLSMIHRADKADKILHAMGKRFGGIEFIPLWPKAGVQAKRIIIRGLKDRKSPAHVYPGLVLHKENGEYTEQTEYILREAKSLT